MDLIIRWLDHPPIDDFYARRLTADTYRQTGRADTGGSLPVEERFDDPGFQAVVTDHRQSASLGEQAHRRVQTLLHIGEFVIDRDAQCLKGLGGGIYPLAGTASQNPANYRCQLTGGLHGPLFYKRPGNAHSTGLFPVTPDQSTQVSFVVGVDYLFSGQVAIGVVPHIQRFVHLETQSVAGALYLS